MSPTVPESRLGHVVGGRYRIISVLGRGGMGVLYTAEHQLTHRRVALKLLHPEHDDLPDLHARFLTEARTAAAVRHPNVVDVLDMGVDSDGSPFLVMELLEGSSLDKTLLERGHLSPATTIEWLLPILGALATLHANDIVHRDVKPSNIFLRSGPRFEMEPKLLDFGLARTMSDLRLTRSGMVLGTPLYMSPEQASGEGVGPQTDIWSMGVVLFECLTGELPFVSRDSGAIAAQVLAGKVRSLSSVRPDLPVPLSNAVEKALRRDLSLRYRSMAEFARGLLVGATASGLQVPEDPDPVGFPDFANWHGQAQLDTTVEVHKSEAPPAPAAAPSRKSDPHELAVAATAVDTASLPKRGFGKGVVVLAALVMLALVAVWFWSAQKPASDMPEHGSSTVTPPAVHQVQRPPAQVTRPAPPTVEPSPAPTDTVQPLQAASASPSPGPSAAQATPSPSEKPATHSKSTKRKGTSGPKPVTEQKPSDIEVEWK